MQIDRSGVTPTDLAGYRTLLEGVFRSAFGDDLIVDAETPLGQAIGLLALQLARIDESGVSVSNGLSVAHSQGFQIDFLGSLLNIERIGGERSTVSATLTGTAGTIIPPGALVRTAGGALFAVDRSVIIEPDGSVAASLKSVEFGPVSAAAGSLTEIVTVVDGWDAITNAAAAELGRLEEVDTVFRGRYRSLVAINAAGTVEAIRSRLLAVEGVRAAVVVDNDGDAPATIRGVTVPAGGIYAVVEGGTDDDVAGAILRSRSGGIGMGGPITVSVPHDLSSERTAISFARVTLVPVAIAVSIRVTPGLFPPDGLSLITRRLVAWFSGEFEALAGQFDVAGIGIGESVDVQRLYTPVQSVPGHTVISLAITVKEGGGALPASTPVNQRYTLAESDITVTPST